MVNIVYNLLTNRGVWVNETSPADTFTKEIGKEEFNKITDSRFLILFFFPFAKLIKVKIYYTGPNILIYEGMIVDLIDTEYAFKLIL